MRDHGALTEEQWNEGVPSSDDHAPPPGYGAPGGHAKPDNYGPPRDRHSYGPPGGMGAPRSYGPPGGGLQHGPPQGNLQYGPPGGFGNADNSGPPSNNLKYGVGPQGIYSSPTSDPYSMFPAGENDRSSYYGRDHRNKDNRDGRSSGRNPLNAQISGKDTPFSLDNMGFGMMSDLKSGPISAGTSFAPGGGSAPSFYGPPTSGPNTFNPSGGLNTFNPTGLLGSSQPTGYGPPGGNEPPPGYNSQFGQLHFQKQDLDLSQNSYQNSQGGYDPYPYESYGPDGGYNGPPQDDED
ncbi:PREDICTED: collagen alpha-1(I) chain-like [Priapulus caudatus]|uniref:Collagen alpha-1(I) chain-like n=1 Tax=Priapulus caudatus TaxID=37621 RepID=A0ABM1F8D3_PRICU|nr:PREDICTED: collagen alpha-1(I) chain-like [Priapulus caudatus]